MTKINRIPSVLAVLGLLLMAYKFSTRASAQPQPPTCATLTVGGLPACNTAVVLTHQMDVWNVNHYCKGVSKGLGADYCQTGEPYTWASGYQPGMWVDYVPSTTSSGAATLAVNELVTGLSVKLVDGVTDPGPRLLAGASFRLVVTRAVGGSGLVWRMTRGDSQ